MKVVRASLARLPDEGVEVLEVVIRLPLLLRIFTGKTVEVRTYRRTMKRKVVHGTYKHWVHPGPWLQLDGSPMGDDGWLLSTAEVIDALAQSQ